MDSQFPTPDENCYTILGIPRGADRDAVQLAYRRLSKTWHPDVNADIDSAECNEAMVAIKAARDILSDDDQRRWHDQLLDRAGQEEGPGREVRGGIARHFDEWRRYNVGARGHLAVKEFREACQRRWDLGRKQKTRQARDIDPIDIERLATCEGSARSAKQTTGTATEFIAHTVTLAILIVAAAAIQGFPSTPMSATMIILDVILARMVSPVLFVWLPRFGFPRAWLIRRISCDPKHAPGILLLKRGDAVFAAPAATVEIRGRFSGLPFFRHLRITAEDGTVLARAILSSRATRKVEGWAANARKMARENPRLALWVSADNCAAAYGFDLVRTTQRPGLRRTQAAVALAVVIAWAALPASGLVQAISARHPQAALVAALKTDWLQTEMTVRNWGHRSNLPNPGSVYRTTVASLDGQVVRLLPADFSRRLGGPVGVMGASR